MSVLPRRITFHANRWCHWPGALSECVHQIQMSPSLPFRNVTAVGGRAAGGRGAPGVAQRPTGARSAKGRRAAATSVTLVCSRSAEPFYEPSELRALGCRALVVPTDVTSRKDLGAMVACRSLRWRRRSVALRSAEQGAIRRAQFLCARRLRPYSLVRT
jgi:hypothetical protein